MQVNAVPADVDLEGSTIIGGVFADLLPAPGSEELFDQVDPALIEAASFEGKAGQLLMAPHATAKTLLLVGLGEETDFQSLRAAMAGAIRSVRTESVFTVLGSVDLEESVKAVVEGAILGSYRFKEYQTPDESEVTVAQLGILGGDDEEVAISVVGADATNLARDWVNTPAIGQAPAAFAESIVASLQGLPVREQIWDLTRIEEESLGGLLGVAAGSPREPRVVILSYAPDGATTHLGLVGKGITFDTGGLTLKPGKAMENMKTDMAGAAAVAAAIGAIARLDLQVRATAVIPITDNAIGGAATRPGDVLRPLSGPTVEVTNTDAEGRLILADGLGLIHHHEPDLIVDIATLTGSMHIALGPSIGGFFANDSDVSDSILQAAARAGEDFWEMPLYEGYRKALDSNTGDIKNVTGSPYGGAIAAALFLKEYAGDGPWAHLDIAGPGRSKETTGEWVKGGSGFGVRTLLEVARGMAAPG